jgi:hypothetical protein
MVNTVAAFDNFQKPLAQNRCGLAGTDVSTSKRSATEPNRLMLFGETVTLYCQSQSHITTDGQSAIMSRYRAHSGTCDQILLSVRRLFSEICCLVFLGHPLWREVGSVICLSLSSNFPLFTSNILLWEPYGTHSYSPNLTGNITSQLQRPKAYRGLQFTQENLIWELPRLCSQTSQAWTSHWSPLCAEDCAVDSSKISNTAMECRAGVGYNMALRPYPRTV